MKRLLILDGDMCAYRNAAALESPQFDWGDDVTTPGSANASTAKNRMDQQIEEFMETLEGDEYFVALSCLDHECFRRRYLPSYKANRADKIRPSCLTELKIHLLENHGAINRPELEADDVMGIKATQPGHESVIVSNDKDFRQIPGNLYNPYPHGRDPVLEGISTDQADGWWMYQTLVGDECDGYKGCPGVGPVKAKKVLAECHSLQEMWQAVVKTFVDRKLTEADALVQARVSRILRWGDWSPKTGVKLWNPPTQQ